MIYVINASLDFKFPRGWGGGGGGGGGVIV